MREVPYNLYKKLDNAVIYKALLDDKYIIEFKEDGKPVCIHFYFDYNGDLIIDNVYKNMRNYRTYRYIKKYAASKELVKIMMQFKD